MIDDNKSTYLKNKINSYETVLSKPLNKIKINDKITIIKKSNLL